MARRVFFLTFSLCLGVLFAWALLCAGKIGFQFPGFICFYLSLAASLALCFLLYHGWKHWRQLSPFHQKRSFQRLLTFIAQSSLVVNIAAPAWIAPREVQDAAMATSEQRQETSWPGAIANDARADQQSTSQEAPQGALSGNSAVILPGPLGVNVNAFNGNLNYPFQLLLLPNLLELDCSLIYNSAAHDALSAAGYYGWRFSYDYSYETAENGDILLYNGGGMAIRFSPAGNGAYHSPPGTRLVMEERQPGQFKLTDGDRKTYYFDSPRHRRITRLEHPNGQALAFEYNLEGLLAAITTSFGQKVQLAYAHDHATPRLSTVTYLDSQAPLIYSFGSDPNRNLTSISNPLSAHTLFSYDAEHHLTTLTQPMGQQLTIAYANSQAISLNMPGFARIFSYDAIQKRTLVIDQVNGQSIPTTYDFDEMGRLLQIEDALGQVQTFTYNDQGMPLSVTDGRGNTYTFTYDSRGNLLSLTDPNASTMEYTYHPALNRLTSDQDALGNVTEYTYDERGNLAKVRLPSGGERHYRVNNLGLVTSITNTEGRGYFFTYDSAGQLSQITDITGYSMTVQYNGLGLLTRLADSQTTRAELEYDLMGRLIRLKDAGGYLTTYEYDSSSRLIRKTDPNGHLFRYEYDQLDRLIQVIDPLGYVTQYDYDEQGNLIGVHDAAGRASQFTHDALGRLVSFRDPLGRERSFLYDAANNLTQYRDARNQTTVYDFDSLDRLVAAHLPGGKLEEYQYDAAGNLLSLAGADAQLAWGYNSLGLPVTHSVASLNKTIHYQYNPLGQRLSMTDPDGVVTTYSYTPRGDLASLKVGSQDPTLFSYDRAGRLIRQDFPNGTYTLFTYDPANRLASLAHYRGNQVIARESYTYDPANNLTTVKDANNAVTSYEYDPLDRLRSVQYSDGRRITYSYDPVGNRIEMIDSVKGITRYLYDDADQLISRQTPTQTITYQYDANGNCISETSATGVVAYSYDSHNHLIAASRTGGSWQNYTYYPGFSDLRLSQADSLGKKYYLYDGMNRLLETDQAGATLTRYSSTPGIHQWLTIQRGANHYTLHSDRLGSILAITDAGGNTQKTFRYDPFGEWLTSSGSMLNYAPGFTGQFYDPALQGYDFHAREYSPGLGRFTSRDPLAGTLWSPLSRNPYIYAQDNPLFYIDPTGEGAVLVIGTTVLLVLATYGLYKYEKSVVEYKTDVLRAAKTQVPQFDPKATEDEFIQSLTDVRKAIPPLAGKGFALAVSTPGATTSGTPPSHLADFANGGLLTIITEMDTIPDPQAPVRSFELTQEEEDLLMSNEISTQRERQNLLNWRNNPKAAWKALDDMRMRLSSGKPKEKIVLKKARWLMNELKRLEDKVDDSFSVASMQAPIAGATGLAPAPGLPLATSNLSNAPPYRRSARIAVLWNGFAQEALAFLRAIGEPYEILEPNFSLTQAQLYPLLLIPTGGLNGLENAASFRQRLEAYVAGGGVLLVSSQQHGYEFSALPGGLEGYGWAEDQSCFNASAGFPLYHQAISSFDKPAINALVDGYLSRYPLSTTVLLERDKNGYPAALLYPFGQGKVMATTIYADWGGSNYQSTSDNQRAWRDMLTWGSLGALHGYQHVLPDFAPLQAIHISAHLRNAAGKSAAYARLVVLDPDKNIIAETLIPANVPAGSDMLLDYDLPGKTALGVWSVDYILLDAQQAPIQAQAIGAAFIISNPSLYTGPNRPWDFWITAPNENWLKGATGEFTFHVRNRTVMPRAAVQVRYGMPHHTWETGDRPTYGNFKDFLQNIGVVNAGEEVTFQVQRTILTMDRIFGYLYENSKEVKDTSFQIRLAAPAVDLALSTDQAQYKPGQPVTITLDAQNRSFGAFEVENLVTVQNPLGQVIYTSSLTASLPAHGNVAQIHPLSLASNTAPGFYTIQALCRVQGTLLAQSKIYFQIPEPPVVVSPVEPPFYIPGASNAITYSLQNLGSSPLSVVRMETSLTRPGGVIIDTDVQTVTLPGGASLMLPVTLNFTDHFGDYSLNYYGLFDGFPKTGSWTIPLSAQIQATQDRSAYRAGESVHVDLQLGNNGQFQEPLRLKLDAPAVGYSQEAAHILKPGDTLIDQRQFALPVDIAAGNIPYTVTLRLDSGSQLQRNFSFSVLPSRLEGAAPSSAIAGQVYTITIANTGGEKTSASFEYRLENRALIRSGVGYLPEISVGESIPITFTIPAGTVSGPYYLVADFHDLRSGETLKLRQRVEIHGVSALVEAFTDQPYYLNNAPVNAHVEITATGEAHPGANLRLQALGPWDGMQWNTHGRGDHYSYIEYLEAIDFDSAGIKWLGGYYYTGEVSAFDDSGTPFNKKDDRWQHFRTADGLLDGYVNDIAIDDRGLKWIALNVGLNVLDDHGTLWDKSDDRWGEFADLDSLTWNNALALDPRGLLWIGSDYGLNMLDDGGTPFDRSDDGWTIYTTTHGLNFEDIETIAVDKNGLVWFGVWGLGLNVLDIKNTPLDTSDDQWLTFPKYPGLTSMSVLDLAIDENGYKWMTVDEQGVFVLDDHGTPFNTADDIWQKFTTADGLPRKYVTSIELDHQGMKWIGMDMGAYMTVLDDNGTPFNKSDDHWLTFTGSDGLLYESYILEIDPLGRKWALSSWGGFSMLDDGGTPFNKSDDRWAVYQPTDGMPDHDVWGFSVDQANLKWFGVTGWGVSALDDGGTPLDKRDDRWQYYSTADGLGTRDNSVIVADNQNYKWFGGMNGASVLDDSGTPFNKSDDRWQKFRTADGLVSNYIYWLEIDTAKRKWYATYGGMSVQNDSGTPFLKTDDQWLSFTKTDGMFGGTSSIVWWLAIDQQDVKWLVGSASVSALVDGGTPFTKADDQWQNFTIADGLLNADLTAVFISPDDLVWITGKDGISVLDDHDTPINKADDTWQTYTHTFMTGAYVYTLKFDPDGVVWVGTDNGLGRLDYHGTPFDTSDDEWQVFTTSDGLASDTIYNSDFDLDGNLWLVGENREGDGVSQLLRSRPLLWQGDFPLNLQDSQTVSASLGPLTTTGKLELFAALFNTAGQVIAEDRYPFYLFPGETSLAIDADRSFYEPGEAVELSVTARNHASVSLTNQALTVTQDGSVIFTAGPFDLPANGHQSFSISTTAQAKPGEMMFIATLQGPGNPKIQATEQAQAAWKNIATEIMAPEIVGRQPFTVSVRLQNDGVAPVDIGVEMNGNQRPVHLAAGEMAWVRQGLQIDQDTIFTVAFTGDLIATHHIPITFGEAVNTTFEPEAMYCTPLAAIPYTLENTGLLALDLPTQITLRQASQVVTSTIAPVFLPVGAEHTGNLLYNIPAGQYRLEWQHDLASGQETFRMAEARALAFSAQAGVLSDAQIPYTATIENQGCQPFSGSLTLQILATGNTIYQETHPLTLIPDANVHEGFLLDMRGWTAGQYTATLSLADSGGLVLANQVFTVQLPGADLQFVNLPDVLELNAGQTYTWTVQVVNHGMVGDAATVEFDLGDLADETQVKYIEAGETQSFPFTFHIPYGVPSGEYRLSLSLSSPNDPLGDRREWDAQIEGVALEISASFDQPDYLPGATAQLSLQITNHSASPTGDLLALSAYNSQPQTQTFSLAGGGVTTLHFNWTANESGDRQVFYGVYGDLQDRGVYLNTIYLRVRNPGLALYTDKQVYQPGQTIHASAVTTLTQGALSVFAFGEVYTAPLGSPIQLDIHISEEVQRGTAPLYSVVHGSHTPFDGREQVTYVDIAAPWVRVMEASLSSGIYQPGQALTGTLVIASDSPVQRQVWAWVRAPDGSVGPVSHSIVNLVPSLTNIVAISAIVSDEQMGTHYLEYAITSVNESGKPEMPDESLPTPQGAEAFDVGQASLLAVHTDQEAYSSLGDPVKAVVEVQAVTAGSYQLKLQIDSGALTAQPVDLVAGIETLTITLPAPIPAGEHVLTATLQAGDLWSQATTRFTYGAGLPDLVAGKPQLGAGPISARPLSAAIINQGQGASTATTALFYDGDPTQGGILIGAALLSSLPPGGKTLATVHWDTTGKGGEHDIFLLVTPVLEYQSGNNLNTSHLELPRFAGSLQIEPTLINPGDKVTVNLGIANLQGAASLPIQAQLAIYSPRGITVTYQIRQVTLTPAQHLLLPVNWISPADSPPGAYCVHLTLVDNLGAKQVIVGWLQVSIMRRAYLPLVRK